MERFIATSQSLDCQAPADDAQWVDLYFPKVEDMLRTLAQVEDERRQSRHALLFGSWSLTTAAVVAFLCVPGCATGAILLMKARTLDVPSISAPQETIHDPVSVEIPAKADRLPLLETSVRNRFTDISPALTTIVDQAAVVAEIPVVQGALPGDIALRGTIEPAAFVTSATEPPAVISAPAVLPKPIKRSVSRAMPVKAPVEHVEVAPTPPPSLFEKLFGSLVPQPSQPNQRQT